MLVKNGKPGQKVKVHLDQKRYFTEEVRAKKRLKTNKNDMDSR